MRPKNITGKAFQDALEYVGITVNKNMIPFDTEKPSVTSGVRIGLTSVSQRGFKEAEIIKTAEIINQVSEALDDRDNLERCKARALELILGFPLYKEPIQKGDLK